jgi:hypothetical protein
MFHSTLMTQYQRNIPSTYRNISQLLDLLGEEAESLLKHVCKTVPKEQLYLPSSSHLDNCFVQSNRNGQTIRSLVQLYQHGRLSGTGYLSFRAIGSVHFVAVEFISTEKCKKSF